MSTVFLSFGPNSGFLTGHIINSFIECTDSPPLWYSESTSGLLPNVVFFDNAKTVKLYEDYDAAFEKDPSLTKVQKIQLPPDAPVQLPTFKPTPFIEYIKKGGATSIPLDQPRPNFQLENADIGWCDILNFNIKRRSFCEIPGTDTEPMNTFAAGLQKASENENYDEYTDPIRRNFENCDRVGACVIIADRNNGFGGFASKLSEYVMEEVPKAVRFVFSTAEEVESDEIASNASLSTAAFLEMANIHTILMEPSVYPNAIDINKYKKNNKFTRMGLLSMPMVSALTPLLNGTATPRNYLDIIAPSPILKFAALDSCFPSFDKMVPFSFTAEERIFSRYVTTCGLGDSASGAINALRPGASFFFDSSSCPQPVFIGINSPHFFKDNYITMEGMKPTEKPPMLSDDDYKRLISAGVIKPKLGVPCDRLRALSSVSCFSTSASLTKPLENSIGFIRNSPNITHDIAEVDAMEKAEIIHNIIDGLNSCE